MGRTAKEESDVGRAKETVQALEQQLADLEAQFKRNSTNSPSKVDPSTLELTTKSVKPKKTNISVQTVALAWAPYWQPGRGAANPAFQ